MEFVTQNSGQLNIIFLHGWGADYSSFFWIKDLLMHARLHFANLDGFGGIPAPSDSSIAGYSLRLHEYISQNNLKNVVLVGHSFGGRVAIEYASKNSILGLVLVDSAGIKPRISIKKRIKILRYKFAKWQVQHGLAIQTKLKKFGSLDYQNCDPKMKKVLVECVNYNQKPLLKNITTKTLIVWGNKDTETPIYMAKTINRHIKDSSLVVLSDCGHFSFLDRPFEFYQILNGFINDLIKGEKYV